MALGFSALLGIWFALSLANQFPRWRDRIDRYDAWALIPLWTFFAPNPGKRDVRVFYRDRTVQGGVGPVLELPLYSQRRWFHFIWHPEKRTAVLGMAALICHNHVADARLPAAALMLSPAYMAILQAVASLPASPDVSHRQLVLAETDGYTRVNEPLVFFVSPFHPISMS